LAEALKNALFDQFAKITDRMQANPDMDLEGVRFLLEECGTLASEPTDVTYEDVDAGGVPAIHIRPLGAAADRVIVYTHGGGCVTNSAASHRKLAGHLAKAAGVHSLVVDYRLAPENPFPTQIEDTLKAHTWLRANGYRPEHTATAGDSAGGNLAITTVLKLRELGEALPAAVIAFSPWVDMENIGETLETNAATDALVKKELSVNMAAMYLGEASPTDPLANPLYADLTGFPPAFVSAGGAEGLLDNATRFVERAKAAGVDTTYEEAAGHQHVYQFMAGRDEDADRTIANVAAWLRPRLGLS
jgi:acetyl esterase/lipase